MDQRGQGNGEKYAPEPPDASKDENRADDRHRVQIDDFGQQQRRPQQQMTYSHEEYCRLLPILDR